MLNDSHSLNDHHVYPPDRRNEKLYILRFLKTLFDSDAVLDLTPKTPALLLQIVLREDDLFYSQPVKFFNEDLQRRTGLTKHTLPAARDKAVEHGWLHFQSGGNHAGTYWTLIPNWAAKMYAAKRQKGSLFVEPCLPENREAHHVQLPENREAVPAQRPANREANPVCLPDNREHLTPTPSLPIPKANGWGAVEKQLKELGLESAPQTIRTAQQHGYALKTLRDIVSHYATHQAAWRSVGVVRNAIVNHPSTLAFDHDDRWPPFAVEYVERQRYERRNAAQAADQKRRTERQAAAAEQRQRDAAELQRLEQTHGSRLDAMTPAELESLIEKHPLEFHRSRLLQSVQIRGHTDDILRPDLLRLCETTFRPKCSDGQPAVIPIRDTG